MSDSSTGGGGGAGSYYDKGEVLPVHCTVRSAHAHIRINMYAGREARDGIVCSFPALSFRNPTRKAAMDYAQVARRSAAHSMYAPLRAPA